MRNDPSDNGGLFVGRRPGSQKPKYGKAPEAGSPARQRLDRALAVGLCGAMALIVIFTIVVVPPGALWVVAHIEYLQERLFLALCVALLIILGMGLGALSALLKMDRAWVLLRRAGGKDQRAGILGLMVALGVGLIMVAGGVYLIFLGGLASTPMGPQLP